MTASPLLSAPVPDVAPEDVERVEDVVRALEKALRAHQLYEGSSPSYERFVEILRFTFQTLWEHASTLTLDVHDTRLSWRGRSVYAGQPRPGDLAFMFYRDGIRELVFRPGFEGRELATFMALLAGVQRARADQDDLITLFWEHDFEHFEHRHVDLAVDEIDRFTREPAKPGPIDVSHVRAGAGEPGAPPEPFESPLEIEDSGAQLDDAELKFLREELKTELARDLMRDVLHALLDRLQDGTSERQQRIIRILADLLPGLISGGRFREATLVLQELSNAAAAQHLPGEVRARIEELFARLAEPDTIREMVRTVEDAPSAIRVEECAALLRYFPPAALEPLLVAAESTQAPEVRQTLLAVAQHMVAGDPRRLLNLLGAESPLLAAGAARMVGSLGIAGAAQALGRMLERPEPAVRLAAIAALQHTRSVAAAGTLHSVLEDPDREVRMAAARALGALRHAGSRAPLEALIQSRQVREADISERIAFFEAYGCVAGREGVEVLVKILNGRTWLGRREPPEIRASAALALGRIDEPAARQALLDAAQDPDMVVRSAVARGLRR